MELYLAQLNLFSKSPFRLTASWQLPFLVLDWNKNLSWSIQPLHLGSSTGAWSACWNTEQCFQVGKYLQALWARNAAWVTIQKRVWYKEEMACYVVILPPRSRPLYSGWVSNTDQCPSQTLFPDWRYQVGCGTMHVLWN